jgi:hypothetical protein
LEAILVYVLEEGFVCALLIALLGASLFAAASLALVARAILRAGLERVALWVTVYRQNPEALYYQQPAPSPNEQFATDD